MELIKNVSSRDMLNAGWYSHLCLAEPLYAQALCRTRVR